ncbi:J domain-containing protein [Sulfurospirillum sp. 1612]|uniref:J domain-containing protein n=1 Tax=Sulfurospirillum sp. 1612 TaxID=3094835 RepID=UPI002F921856
MIETKTFELIQDALDVMDLPPFIDMGELKTRYKELARINHPDAGGDEEKMIQINQAYNILKEYMENFKFSFTQEEINKQFPQEQYASQFKF